MEKKRLVSFLLIFACVLAIIGFACVSVNALGEAESPIATGDLEKVQNLTNQIPINEQGGIDSEKLGAWKTQAELRIEAINLWLKTNAMWLTIVFGMVPEISWLFAFNFYILLLFFVNLVLNGLIIKIPVELMMVFARKGEEKVMTISRIIGLIIFVALLEFKVFLHLAQFSLTIWGFIWEKVIPIGTIVAIVVGILLVVALIILMVFAPEVLLTLDKAYMAWKEKREKDKESQNRKKLEEDIEVAEGFVKGVTGK